MPLTTPAAATQNATAATAPQDLDAVTTLAELFQFRCQATPQREAYRWFDTASNAWQPHSWAAMHAEVARWTQAVHPAARRRAHCHHAHAQRARHLH